MNSSNDTGLKPLIDTLRATIELANAQLLAGTRITGSTREELVELHSSLTSVLLGSFDNPVQPEPEPENIPLIQPAGVSQEALDRLWHEMNQVTWEEYQAIISTTAHSPSHQTFSSTTANVSFDQGIPADFNPEALEYAQWSIESLIPAVNDPILHYDYSTELSLLSEQIESV
ncbi:hypothetical protein VNI00_012938 [Paramarasmius palmivorus]|uniref:Uncharacterized protein n=1 Tax=Paramarasmius palmivorus TaxID=297713 RepID=A0AAW0C2P8_9AGAR